jgi:hypothetical protein
MPRNIALCRTDGPMDIESTRLPRVGRRHAASNAMSEAKNMKSHVLATPADLVAISAARRAQNGWMVSAHRFQGSE